MPSQVGLGLIQKFYGLRYGRREVLEPLSFVAFITRKLHIRCMPIGFVVSPALIINPVVYTPIVL